MDFHVHSSKRKSIFYRIKHTRCRAFIHLAGHKMKVHGRGVAQYEDALHDEPTEIDRASCTFSVIIHKQRSDE